MKLTVLIAIFWVCFSITTFASNDVKLTNMSEKSVTMSASNKSNPNFAALQAKLEKALTDLKTNVINFLRCPTCKY